MRENEATERAVRLLQPIADLLVHTTRYTKMLSRIADALIEANGEEHDDTGRLDFLLSREWVSVLCEGPDEAIIEVPMTREGIDKLLREDG